MTKSPIQFPFQFPFPFPLSSFSMYFHPFLPNDPQEKQRMMESGYKHFSHTHNLTMHEIPEGAEVSCSGCNSWATQTVYVCWRCNFFLHDQCFHATRSRKHPSHPSHPLTLVPYPTYPSNSFYCNSCKIIGTGFSYSCSDCDFDLHIQCAYSIAGVTNFHQSHQVITSPPHPHHISYPNQQIVQPYLHAHNTSMVLPNIPSLSIPVHTQYQTTITQDSYMAQNPISGAQNAYMSQNFSISPSTQNPSRPQNIALIFVPTSAPNKQSESTHYVNESGQNKPKNEGIKHYSHPHGLVLVTLKNGKNKTTCSCCQETLIGEGYSCIKERCNFHLHESCFNLDKEIRHKSHPDHPLTLLSSSPYKNENGTFTCNACFKDGTGFTYHCSICEHDLHVKCANLKETMKRDDHEHMLKLLYKCPLKGEEYTFYCDVCNQVVPKDYWTYYCKVCDYGTHLDCVDGEVCDEISEDPVVDVRSDLKRLEEAIEIARIDAIGRANSLNNI